MNADRRRSNHRLLRACLVALAALLAAPGAAWAQGARRGAGGAARAQTAAARTVKGNLRGAVIAVRGDADRHLFDYVVAEARVVGGRLELVGAIRPPGGRHAGPAASATLLGTLSKEAAPEYHAGRARRAAAQRRAAQPASGAPAEQQPGGPPATAESAGQVGQLAQSTQSTARDTEPVAPEGGRPREELAPAAAGPVTGCEVMFFRVALPPRYAAAAGGPNVQLNVAFARLDNQAGLEIGRHVCRVASALGSGEDAAAEVADLNRALGAAR